mmetsp:Transcript_6592/g.13349  ORF Transcript_6592/g.13349 Transcript_6592/m.13349 type:complete len:107 (-) Transcript_6592:92-412(-)
MNSTVCGDDINAKVLVASSYATIYGEDLPYNRHILHWCSPFRWLQARWRVLLQEDQGNPFSLSFAAPRVCTYNISSEMGGNSSENTVWQEAAQNLEALVRREVGSS